MTAQAARTWTCGQDGCSEPATLAVRWPGAPYHRPACDSHASKARSVAGALGFVAEVRGCAELAEENRIQDAKRTAAVLLLLGAAFENIEAAESPQGLRAVAQGIEQAAKALRELAEFRAGAIL